MKILFNCLPPANIDHPSPAFSILQSFLNHNGYDSRTIYWNILTSPVMSYYPHRDDLLRNLVPFLSILATDYNDDTAKNNLCSYLHAIQPRYRKIENFYKNSLEEIHDTTKQLISSVLSQKENEAVIYGISAKFFQWIPGVVLARAIKIINPQSKIVVGGFGNKDSAAAVMRRFHEFDFALWGEGEYPMLELCKQIGNDTYDLKKIPRLVYRENKSVKISEQTYSKYLDFKNYIFPDVSDYFKTAAAGRIPRNISTIMLNTVNGCRWNKCAFCTYPENKIFRERTAENIFEEIRDCHEKYKVRNFYFADNDLVGRDIGRLEKLLDLLAEYRKKNKIILYGEMIPSSKITPLIFLKMIAAGFSKLYIGYEAVTDRLLKDMRKENNFSENILFVKNAVRSRIRPQLHIIQGIPSELEADVKESMDNLHFLRFLFSDDEIEITHKYITLEISKGTEYWRDMPASEKKNYVRNPIINFIPASFTDPEERFDFFSFRRSELKNKKLWQDFVSLERSYREKKYSYTIEKNKMNLRYREYLNGKEITSIRFDDPAYYDILSASDATIVTFDKMFDLLSEKYIDITKVRLKEYLSELKKHFLLYCNERFSSIVSVISIDRN